MEETDPFIIPTLSKAKISSRLSYPIGAEQITAALGSVSQLHWLKLHFYSRSNRAFRHGNFEFLRVEYLNEQRAEPKWPIWNLYNRPPQYRWEIVVQPVAREVRQYVKQYILESALPQIADWLNARADLNQRGNDILAFFYDETQKEFSSHAMTQVEPMRV